MFWLGLVLVLVLSFVCRYYVNRGQTTASPDEKRYSTYAFAWRPGKRYTADIEDFLKKPDLEIPPTRFGFFCVCALVCRGLRDWTRCFKPVTWVAAVSATLLAPVAYCITRDLPSSLLVASSPLSLFLSRKALQDSFTGLLMLMAVWGVALANPWLLAIGLMLSLISREAMIFYVPALALAWWLRGGSLLGGAAALISGTLLAVGAYYAVGGRKLREVFFKLRQSTTYVRRFQSGMPHRLLVDLVLASPLVVLCALINWHLEPVWLLAFAGASLFIHSFITPKNLRFILVVDVCVRMLCAYLPGLWSWVALAVGLVADYYLFKAFGKAEDPVTANLVAKTGMYSES